MTNTFEKVDNTLEGVVYFEKESIKQYLVNELRNEADQVYYFMTLDSKDMIQAVYRKQGEPTTIEVFKLAILEEAAKIILGCKTEGTFSIIDIFSDEMTCAEEMDCLGIIINIPVEYHYIINDAYTFVFQDFLVKGTSN